jgi:hypothetical protein
VGLILTLAVISRAGSTKALADAQDERTMYMVRQRVRDARLSKGVKDPVTATALALETVGPDGSVAEQAIMVSCDLISIRKSTMESVRRLLKERLPNFDSEKVLLNATHTHQGPQQQSGTSRGIYALTPEEKPKGWMTGDGYGEFLAQRVAEAAVKAWNSRKPAEFHMLRLGDVAMVTCPFELFIDDGMRIRARSKALMTFVIQLSCGHSEYLSTTRAIHGGGYSAELYLVGPKGGRVLIDESVERINAFWP